VEYLHSQFLLFSLNTLQGVPSDAGVTCLLCVFITKSKEMRAEAHASDRLAKQMVPCRPISRFFFTKQRTHALFAISTTPIKAQKRK